MNKYLAVITTVLVATQIIRVIQNAMQLKKVGSTYEEHRMVIKTYDKLNIVLDSKIEEMGVDRY
jgi:uncharacterized protein YvpB